jgi:hypothetical protein
MSTVQTNARQRVLAQIDALLSLSKSPNAHEAAAASEKAQALILKHKIEQYEIDCREEEHVEMPVGHKATTIQGVVKTDWVTTLASGIARANVCKVLYSKHSVTFIGTEDSTELAIYMFNNLHRQLVNMVRDEVRKHTQECKAQGIPVTYGPHNHQIYRRSWLLGAAIEISRALYGEYEVFSTSSSGNAIVVRDQARIEAYEKETWPHIRSFSTCHQSLNGTGYGRGKEAGKNIRAEGGLNATRSSSLSLGSGR